MSKKRKASHKTVSEIMKANEKIEKWRTWHNCNGVIRKYPSCFCSMNKGLHEEGVDFQVDADGNKITKI